MMTNRPGRLVTPPSSKCIEMLELAADQRLRRSADAHRDATTVKSHVFRG